MGPTSATTVRRLRLLALSAALPLAGCSPFHHGFFAAAGPVADHERHLFVIVSIVMLFVIGPVLLLTPIFAWHYRLANTKSAYRPHVADRRAGVEIAPRGQQKVDFVFSTRFVAQRG